METNVNVYSLAADGNRQASENFKVREFRSKDGADAIFVSQKLVTLVQNIRNHFGRPLIINSAYRTASHNQAVGGARYSQHLYGTAADIVVSGVHPSAVADYAESLLPNSGGIGRYAGFTHVDVREQKSRWHG